MTPLSSLPFLLLVQAMYQYYCSFSGASLFNSFSLSTYNVLFTGLPILFFVLDKDIREDMILRYPFVYQETVRSTSFNRELFLGWFLRAILQSLIAFLFGMAVFGWEDTASSPGGGTMGETNIALLIFSAGIVIQTGTVLFQSSILTVWNNAVIFGTLALFFVMVGIVSTMPGLGMFGSAAELFSNGGYWFGLLVISVTALVPFLTVKFAVFNYRPKFFEYM